MRRPFAAGCIALLAVAWACGGEAVPEIPDGTGAPATLVVDTATLALPVALPAQLYVEHNAYVYARATGIVERVRVDIGDRVRAGQVLAEMESVDQEIALESAEANLANAARLVERFRELAGSGAVTVADSEQAELDYTDWQLAARQARRNYELTRAVAPFDGVIAGRTVRPGRLVEEFDPLFRVTALRPLRASVRLPEQSGRVDPGTAVQVVALDGTAHEAAVERVSPTVDPGSGTREVIVRLEDALGLEPGASVHVRLAAAPRLVVIIPFEVIVDDEYVLVFEDGRTALRRVTLGARLDDGRVEVLSGLARGERVVRSMP